LPCGGPGVACPPGGAGGGPGRWGLSFWAPGGRPPQAGGQGRTGAIPGWAGGGAARHHAVITPSWRSVRVGVCGHDLGRNAATLGDVETVVPGPFTNRLGIAGRALGGRLAGGPACGCRGPAARLGAGRHHVAERLGILVAQVDLVFLAAKAERDHIRVVSQLGAVEVVDVLDMGLLRHYLPYRWRDLFADYYAPIRVDGHPR